MKDYNLIDYCMGDGCPLKMTCWCYLAWMTRDDLDGGIPPEDFIAPDYDEKEKRCVNYYRRDFYDR